MFDWVGEEIVVRCLQAKQPELIRRRQPNAQETTLNYGKLTAGVPSWIQIADG